MIKEKLEALLKDEAEVIGDIESLQAQVQQQVAYLNKIQGGIETLKQLLNEEQNEEVNSVERGEESEEQ
jgi:hypothetical protein